MLIHTHTDGLQKQPPWETVNSPNHKVHDRVRGVMGKQDPSAESAT